MVGEGETEEEKVKTFRPHADILSKKTMSFLQLCNYVSSFELLMYVILLMQVFLPGDPMENDEELTFDKSAYHMYHAVRSLKTLLITTRT